MPSLNTFLAKSTFFSSSRRGFCGAFLGLGLSVNTPVFATPSLNSNALFLSAASNKDDEHFVLGFTVEKDVSHIHFKQQLPGRAHHIAIREDKNLFIVIARRPGTYLIVGELTTGKIIQKIELPTDRHLLGHGIFSADGEVFYTTESAYSETGNNGLLVSWQVFSQNGNVNLSRQQEFSTHGIGPHELVLLPDHNTIVVANGGIKTHPDSGREKLNLLSMQPSLVYLDRFSGRLIEQHYLSHEFHQSSIRHLDVNAEGLLAIAMQFEGEPFEIAPLIATHKRGEALTVFELPLNLQPQMKQYVGSIKFDLSGRYIAASCPRGNLITFWDSDTGQLVESLRSRDGCGLSSVEKGFMVTAGTGNVSYFNLQDLSLTAIDSLIEPLNETVKNQLFWDNHLSSS